MKREAWSAGILLLVAGCELTQDHDFHAIPLEIPEPNRETLEMWRKNDPWRSDPIRVADQELLLRLDVPWKGQPFNPARYQFIEGNPKHPEWGTYIVRGYVDGHDRNFRYRVQMARDGDLWYVRSIAHMVIVNLNNPIFDEGPPPLGR